MRRPQARRPDIRVSTFSGNITAHLADGVKSGVSFNTFSGRFDSDLPVSMRTMERHSASKGKGDSAGLPETGSGLSFHTFSGNVKVQK